MKNINADHDKTINEAERSYRAQDLSKEANMLENKIMADASTPVGEVPLTGWALLTQEIALEEAERQRALKGIPDFRARAINAVAYWTSLAHRVESLGRTKQLLEQLQASPQPVAPDCGLPPGPN